MQPDPTPGTGDVWLDILSSEAGWLPDRVDTLGWSRRELGRSRYGVPLPPWAPPDFRREAAEELADGAAYLWAAGWRWTARLLLVVAWWVMR